MSEEFGPDFISLTDEDGNEFEVEVVDILEHNGITYVACFPTVDEDTSEEEAEDYGLVILKYVEEADGEMYLATPDTDEELNEVYELFMEQLDEEEEDS